MKWRFFYNAVGLFAGVQLTKSAHFPLFPRTKQNFAFEESDFYYSTIISGDDLHSTILSLSMR